MTTEALKKGKQLQDEIQEFQRVLEHFTRVRTETDNIEFLTNFFLKCSNLGSSTLKKHLAILCEDTIKETLRVEISSKQKEFNEL